MSSKAAARNPAEGQLLGDASCAWKLGPMNHFPWTSTGPIDVVLSGCVRVCLVGRVCLQISKATQTAQVSCSRAGYSQPSAHFIWTADRFNSCFVVHLFASLPPVLVVWILTADMEHHALSRDITDIEVTTCFFCYYIKLRNSSRWLLWSSLHVLLHEMNGIDRGTHSNVSPTSSTFPLLIWDPVGSQVVQCPTSLESSSWRPLDALPSLQLATIFPLN